MDNKTISNRSLNGNGNSKKEEFLPKSKKVYVKGKIYKDIKVPFREIELTPTRLHNGNIEQNEPLMVYDTSGLWGDESEKGDVKKGLPALREKWIKSRGDVEEYEGRNVKPSDNGYQTHDEIEKAKQASNGKLEHFPDFEENRLKQNPAQL